MKVRRAYQKRWAGAEQQFRLLYRNYSFASLTEAVRDLNQTVPEGITVKKYQDFLHYLDQYYLSVDRTKLELGLRRRSELIIPVFERHSRILADFTRCLLDSVEQR